MILVSIPVSGVSSILVKNVISTTRHSYSALSKVHLHSMDTIRMNDLISACLTFCGALDISNKLQVTRDTV